MTSPLTRIQLRRGTAAAWTAANPVLGAGEQGLETDTGKVKIGNGSNAWADLTYEVSRSELATKANASTVAGKQDKATLAADTAAALITPGNDLYVAGRAASASAAAEAAGDRTTDLRKKLDATFSPSLPRQLSPLVGVLGDSLAANEDTAAMRRNSPLHYASLRSLGKIQYAWMGGVPGETSAQILARAADAVTSPAQTIVVDVGPNDAAGTGPFDTVTRPNLDTIVAALLAGGKTPVLCTLPPRGTSASPASTAQKLFISRYNLYVRRLAARLGTPLVDYFKALTDPSGDYYSASVANDGVHPNPAGWSVMGTVLSDALTPLLGPPATPLPTANNDTASITDNCLMLATSGGIATGWSIAAGVSGQDGFTVSTPAAAIGNKLRMDCAGTTVQKAVWRPNIPVTPGNRLLVVCAAAWSGVLVDVQIDRIAGGSTTYGVLKPLSRTPAAQTTATPLLAEYVPPAGTTAINVELVTQPGTGYAEISQFAVYDLTAQQQL